MVIELRAKFREFVWREEMFRDGTDPAKPS